MADVEKGVDLAEELITDGMRAIDLGHRGNGFIEIPVSASGRRLHIPNDRNLLRRDQTSKFHDEGPPAASLFLAQTG